MSLESSPGGRALAGILDAIDRHCDGLVAEEKKRLIACLQESDYTNNEQKRCIKKTVRDEIDKKLTLFRLEKSGDLMEYAAGRIEEGVGDLDGGDDDEPA